MRAIAITLGVALFAVLCMAEPRSATFSLSTGEIGGATGTTTAISGYIDEIVLESPTAAATGTVRVTATPVVGDAVVLATNTVTATKLVRPRFDGTDTEGAALTSDPPGRYMSASDKITVTVAGATTTGLTWKVLVKFDDMRR